MLLNRPLTTQQISKILCGYFNPTHQMQIIRLADRNSYSWEKVVFPNERVLFEAIPDGRLEVHIERQKRQVLEETIPCHSLQVY